MPFICSSNVPFTPGPWAADNGDGDSYWGVFADRDSDAICYLVEWSGMAKRLRPEQDAANARLMAAAPAMYEALKQWKCPSCGGTMKYTGYSKNAPAGQDCRTCANTGGLHPVAFAALSTAVD